jgi:hypothetical protein
LKLFCLCDSGKIQFELFWAGVIDLIHSRSDMCLLYDPWPVVSFEKDGGSGFDQEAHKD